MNVNWTSQGGCRDSVGNDGGFRCTHHYRGFHIAGGTERVYAVWKQADDVEKVLFAKNLDMEQAFSADELIEIWNQRYSREYTKKEINKAIKDLKKMIGAS